MTSTRLPGKVLRPLGARPMLAQQLRRLRHCREIDEICIATTTNSSDDGVVELARSEDASWFRGSEADVLSRFVGAARQTKADVVVRLTADCPLCDPATIERVILALMQTPQTTDYVANFLPRTFPQGLDAEALWSDVLERTARLFASPQAREHVTAGIYSERPEVFLLSNVAHHRDDSDLRWTVDTLADWQMASAFYEQLGLDERVAPLDEMLAFARAHPEVTSLNAGEKTWSPLPQTRTNG